MTYIINPLILKCIKIIYFIIKYYFINNKSYLLINVRNYIFLFLFFNYKNKNKLICKENCYINKEYKQSFFEISSNFFYLQF